MEDELVFTNDDNVNVKLIKHKFTEIFKTRDSHEVMFRRINTYLIKNKIIDGNIIDLGSWMGDNSIPWALNLQHTIYAIDPSPNNINFIEEMKKTNNITNIKTIQTAISDKNEVITTNSGINHCTFTKQGGKRSIEAVTLDYLYSRREIDNIAYIHLDVEGFEYNVIKGSENIIKVFKPIITYEQHFEKDDYKGLSIHLYNQGYNIYLINEIMPGCRLDCRNLLAIPKEINKTFPDLMNKLNNTIGKNVLLSVLHWHNTPYKYMFTATFYGDYMNKQIFKNVKSVEYDDKHIFCVTHDDHSKIVVIDKNKNWLCSKFLQGIINTSCKQTIINAYLTAQGNVYQHNYDVKDICEFYI